MIRISKIQKTILGTFVIIATGLVAIVSSFLVYKSTASMSEKDRTKSQIQAANLAKASADGVLMAEWDRLQKNLKDLADTDKDVVYAMIVQPDGTVGAAIPVDFKDKKLNADAVDKAALEAKEVAIIAPRDASASYEVAAPITFGGQYSGVLRLGFSDQSIRNLRNSIIKFSLILVVAGIVVGSIIYYVAAERLIVRQIRHNVDRLIAEANRTAEASEVLLSGSQKVSEGALQQAASLEETSAAMEELTSMAKGSADSAQQSKNETTRTLSTTRQGVDEMNGLKSAVEKVNKRTAEMTQAMSEIRAATDSISKIIKGIDEIAFQTNILALNAAVEAARAGEAGLGFAVVAGEVRNLAQRAAENARETGRLIESSIQRTERGVKANQEVTSAMHEILERAHAVETGLQEIVRGMTQVDTNMGQIAASSQEQTRGITQVNESLSRIDKITQNAAGSAKETATSAEGLKRQSGDLQVIVGSLASLVGDANTAQLGAGSPHMES